MLSTYESSSVAVLEAAQVCAPEGAGLVLLNLEESAVAATQTLIDVWCPRLAIIDTDDDTEEFRVHLLSDSWLSVAYLDPEHVDEVPDEIPADQARNLLKEVVDELDAADLPADHSRFERVFDAINTQLRDSHPEIYPRIRAAVGREFADYANALAGRLRDRHVSAFRNDAPALAAQIAAAESVCKGTTRPVLRDIVYSYMKRVDPSCVTRTSVEPIALELGLYLKRA